MSEEKKPSVLESFIPDVKFGTVDAKKLGTDIADIITQSLEGLVEGAQDDIRSYANRMANDAIRVMAIPDVAKREQLLNALAQQVVLIGEIHRLKATQASWDVAGKIFKTIIKTAVKLVIPI